MSGEFRYKAFISYSHADVKWAKWLHRTLETYRTPRRLQSLKTARGDVVPSRLSPVFRDRDDFASTHDLSASIRVALEQSENLIVICSPQAAASKWVNKEIESFKKQGRQQHIYYFIVTGDPAATGTAQDCFPPAVHQNYDAAGNVTDSFIEPIAADVREQGDGKALARLKIIAGLLGVGLDELRQREQQRKNRRMAIISASSIIASIVTIGLAINATMARDEAERRQQQAEELLGFMVGDLRNSLQPIGRLDVLESVAEQAQHYFATVAVGSLSQEELLRQSQVLTQLGEIHTERLKYDLALEAFTQAYERSAELYRSDPSKGDRLFNRSQAEFWIGFVAWRGGNRPLALQWLTRYRDSALQLLSLDPNRADWRREVGFGHHNLAVLNIEIEEFEAAADALNLEIVILDRLIAESPDAHLQVDIADAYSWLGNIAFEQGDIARARNNYEVAKSLAKKLSELEPDNAEWLEDLAFAIQRQAKLLAFTEDKILAMELADEALDLFNALISIDDTNLNARRGRNQPELIRAHLHANSGNYGDALAITEVVLEELAQLQLLGTLDQNLRFQLARAQFVKAWVAESTGDYSAAIEAIEVSERYDSGLGDSDTLNNERIGFRASILALKGELLADAGSTEDAIQHWRRAADLLRSRVENSDSPYLLDPWYRTLIHLGEHEEARSVRTDLNARNYQPLLPWPG